MKSRLRTVKQVRRDLAFRGLTMADWARANGFKAERVQDLLYGKSKGKFGASHAVAVALGLKHGLIEPAQGRRLAHRAKRSTR